MKGNIVLLAALVALAGCASHPAATTGSEATQFAEAARVAAPPAEAPVAGSPPAESAGAKDPYPGWTKRERSGQTVYCRRMEVTGSMFPQDVCMTPEQLDRALEQQSINAKRLLGKPVGCKSKNEGCQ